MKLRSSLLALAAGTVIPFLAVAAVLVLLLFHYEQQNSRRLAADRIRAFMTAVDAELRGNIATIQALAASQHLRAGDYVAFRAEALNLLSTQPDYLAITVRRADGTPVLSTVGQLSAYVVQRDSFVEATRTRKPAIEGVLQGRRGAEISIRVPVVIDGEVRYMVSVRMELQHFQRLIDAQQIQPGWVIGLVDRDGHFIARQPPVRAQMASAEFMRHARVAPEGWYRGSTVEGFDTFTAHLTSPLSGWTVGHAIPSAEVYASAKRAAWLLVLGIMAASALAFAFAVWLGRRVTGPIEAVASSARRLGFVASSRREHAAPVLAESMAIEPPRSSIDEVRELQRAIGDSARRLKSEFAERDRVECELRASERRFRAFSTASSDVFFRANCDWSEMHQLSAGGFVAGAQQSSHDWLGNYVAPEEQHAFMQAVREAIRSQATFELEHHVQRPDGSLGWARSRAVPLRDADGQITEWFGAVRDITPRKQAEEKLRAAMQRLDSALENSPLAVIEWSTSEFRIHRWSDEATRVFGWTAEEVLGRRLDEIDWVFDEDRPLVQQVMADMLSGKRPRNVNKNRNVRKDGTVIDCEWYNSTVTDPAGNLVSVLSLVLDVTERKRAEQLLDAARVTAQRAQAQAEQASKAKDEFLAVLSHELRTPLTPVLNAAEVLYRSREVGAGAREPLDIIRRNVQMQAHLIDDLLDLTRIAHGKLELKRKPLDIRTVIERAVEVARPDIDARRLQLQIDLAGIACHVDGDASRLQQVIWNLLSNAVKFTPAGGWVRVRCQREDGFVVIEVSDSGIGMDPQHLESIFDAFEQGDRAITRQFGGLGLGLAIAKRLVTMHGGTISAHSLGAGCGASFLVRLPVCSGMPDAPAPTSLPTVHGRSKRILLVEDNDDTAATMAMLLQSFGYEVMSARNVRQALETIQEHPFDLVISDLGLPDGTGLDLLRELRCRGCTVKAIALSGYGQQQDLARTREAGFSTHLVKPVDVDVLMEAISATL